MAPHRPILDRFIEWHEIEPNECWRWLGSLTPAGYPKLTHNRQTVAIHRWSYEHHVAPIPDGLTIDHLCRHRWCVNPFHMEPVTAGENTRRGNAANRDSRVWTHCKVGHPLTEDNTYRKSNGDRECRTCRNVRKRQYRARRRASR